MKYILLKKMKKKIVKKQTKLDKNKELRTHIDKIQVDKLPLIFCKLFPTNDVQITKITNLSLVGFGLCLLRTQSFNRHLQLESSIIDFLQSSFRSQTIYLFINLN
jgi:hypothetical protein